MSCRNIEELIRCDSSPIAGSLQRRLINFRQGLHVHAVKELMGLLKVVRHPTCIVYFSRVNGQDAKITA